MPGAFLVPYLLMLVVLGIPLLFMELTVGQYTRRGPLHAFGIICPLFKGIRICGENMIFQSLKCLNQNRKLTDFDRQFQSYPLSSGLGIASTVICFISSIPYNIFNTWALYYLFNSFQTPLPWQHCNNTWNTPNCTMFASNSTNNSSTASQEFFKCVLGPEALPSPSH